MFVILLKGDAVGDFKDPFADSVEKLAAEAVDEGGVVRHFLHEHLELSFAPFDSIKELCFLFS